MVYNKKVQQEQQQSIAAIATAPGQSAIAIIRISGPDAAAVAAALGGSCPEPGKATLTRFKDEQQEIIDRGIMLYFKAPSSFTGEDMLELHCHGSVAVLEQLMQTLAVLGVAPARPGQFSERAFVNGKMDLSQAEAIAALIESRSIAAARVAAKAVTGEWAARLHLMDKELLSLRARLEAELDFPEDDIDTGKGKIEEDLRRLIQLMEDIQQDSFRGQEIQRGMNVVLAGYPNSGKSTLLNAICGRDRAIVTAQPGTTRDLLQEDMVLSGAHISLVDTAGLRDAADVAEQAGVARAKQAISQADLILLLSAGDTPPELLQELKHLASPQADYILVRTMTDLCGMPGATSSQAGVCAISGEGLDDLRKKIIEYAADKDAEQSALYANSRMAAQLVQARQLLDKSLSQWQEHKGTEILLADLAEFQRLLSAITGSGTTEELLGEIFSRFCIGK